MKLAKSYDIKIYMTIFDAHTYRPDQLSRAELKNLRKVMTPPLLQAIENQTLSQ